MASVPSGTPGPAGQYATALEPQLVSFLPARDAKGVVLGSPLSLRFNVAPLEGQDFSKVLVLQDGPDSFVPLVCSVAVAEKSVSCAPRSPLAPDTLYTATLLERLVFPSGRVLPQGAVWSFRTTRSDDRMPPELTWKFSDAGAVEQGAPLVLYFSEPVKWTGTEASLQVKTAAGAPVAGGTAKAIANALEISLDSTLAPGDHVLTLGAGLADLYDNAFVGNLVVSFSVRSGSARESMTFDEGASDGLGTVQGGARAHGPWNLVFSSPVLPSVATAPGRVRVAAQAAGASSPDVPLVFHFTPQGMRLTPKTRLAYDTPHQLTLRGDFASWERAELATGGATAFVSTPFTTQTELALVSVAPGHAQTEVGLGLAWTATFDRPLAAGLAAADLVDVRDGLGRPVNVTVRVGVQGAAQSSGVETTLSVSPATAWSLSEDYAVTLLAAVRGSDGAGFASQKKFTFKAKADPQWELGPKRVFVARCESCHPTYVNRATAWAWGSRIQRALDSNRMPLGAPLSPADKSAALDWFNAAVAAGAP